MAHNNDTHTTKISSEFAARLAHLTPRQKVRAVVMLCVDSDTQKPARRPSHAERQAKSEAIQKAATPALAAIDAVLEHHDGQRLAMHVNALGSIPIETTATGIRALADSKHVKAILEDQPISLSS